ncbi:MAG: YCF48-related protein [Candidatus Eisenbacteria bacterium]
MPHIPQMRAMRTLVTAAAACGLAFVLGCSDSKPLGPPPIYSSIVISGPDTVLIGGSVTFSATVIDTGGNPVASPGLTFSTSASGVASINNAGVAQGVSEGDVTVRATGGGIQSNALPLAVLQGYGWVDQSSAVPTVQTLRGVFFASNREGWAVGNLGTILHTANAGKNWSTQVSNSTGYTLEAVGFLSPSIGVVVGSAGRVLRTVNGGTNWSVVAVDASGSGLNDVVFQDANRGWIVGNGGVILRTINGGATWTRVLPNATVLDLESVAFPPYNLGGNPPADPYGRGWIVGAGGTILTSSDFGSSWRLVSPFVTSDGLLGVTRRSKVDAVAVGSNDRVLNTFASGDSARWQLAGVPAPLANLTAVSWSPESAAPGHVWAVGKQSAGPAQAIVFHSTDGGGSWAAQALPGSAPLSGNGLEDVFFLDDRRGWAVGEQGLVLHTATGGR